MENLYIWPDQPAMSLVAFWLVSALLLWAAREPMLGLLRSLTNSIEEGLAKASSWCQSTASELRERARATLLAAGSIDLGGKLGREFHRVDNAFAERLGQYSGLQRKLDDMLQKLDDEYRRCGEVPPEVPGWTSAVESMSALPESGDPSVRKILDRIRKSLNEAAKKALDAYRDDSSKRHKTLGGMLPSFKEIRSLLARMSDAVAKALETTTRLNGYVDEYAQLSKGGEAAARALSYSATKLFIVSLIVLGIALGGAFINFQLIALPMAELVPAGARLGGVPVATVAALVIVLMEAAVGMFIMDMLGITELFPKLLSVPTGRRRLILGLSLGGLFFLASVESSLAILRELIVEADAALKMSLAGDQAAIVTTASSSNIPVIGQAVLGFILPWILAMVAIPLEMLLDSGRHVMASLAALLLSAFGNALRVLGHVLRSLLSMLPNLYDVYIAVPMRIERMVQGANRTQHGSTRARKAALPRGEVA